MKRIASPPQSPRSSNARLTAAENEVRNQAPNIHAINQPIPIIFSRPTKPIPDWMFPENIKLIQQSREQLGGLHIRT